MFNREMVIHEDERGERQSHLKIIAKALVRKYPGDRLKLLNEGEGEND